MLSLPPARLIGVIHLRPTPGAPAYEAGCGSAGMRELLERAVRDAEAYARGGVSHLIVENYHDAPFWKSGVAPETIAALALAVDRVAGVDGVEDVGVNVLRNDARAALGIASATGASFIRVNVHTGAMFTDQGLIEGRAADTLRERARLGSSVRILADVHVKHATPIAGEALEDAARDALHRGRADALVVSGAATGSAPDRERVERLRSAVGPGVPILVGSGFSLQTAVPLLRFADAAIVGTAAKRGGLVENEVDPERVAALVDAAASAG